MPTNCDGHHLGLYLSYRIVRTLSKNLVSETEGPLTITWGKEKTKKEKGTTTHVTLLDRHSIYHPCGSRSSHRVEERCSAKEGGRDSREEGGKDGKTGVTMGHGAWGSRGHGA